MSTEPNQGSIGVTDSGVGGLSVLRHVQQLLPAEKLLYVADQAHVPYGPQPVDLVRRYCQGISSFLIENGAKIIVVACNTASAGALSYLRTKFPKIPIVGMEPAIKPGAHTTTSGKIGVLATPGTFDSVRYARLMSQFAGDIDVFEDPCLGLVELIEDGHLEGHRPESILKRAINPMLAAGVDTLVLGCTHYPFLLPLINKIAGSEAAVIDPAPSVALQVKRVLKSRDLIAPSSGEGLLETYTTGGLEPFVHSQKNLLGQSYPAKPLSWQDGYRLEIEE